jgi:hypothetical protein
MVRAVKLLVKGGHGDIPNARNMKRRRATMRFLTSRVEGGEWSFFVDGATRDGTAATDRVCQHDEYGE